MHAGGKSDAHLDFLHVETFQVLISFSPRNLAALDELGAMVAPTGNIAVPIAAVLRL